MPGQVPFRTVTVVGLGLLGGSLARALRRLPASPRLLASSLDRDDLEAALADGIVDEVDVDADAVVGAAELVVYATPLEATLDLLPRHRERWAPEAVITDVASLKLPVAERLRELDALRRWVGAHPMAGSEASGYGASWSDLFRGERVWLVAGGAPEEVRGRVEAVWRSVGARTGWIEPRTHDDRMASVSHAPQLVATALALALEGAGVERADLGTGGRDAVRLAGSPPGMWRQLLARSPASVTEVLESAEDALRELRTALAEGNLDEVESLLSRGRRWWEDRG